MPFTCTRCGAFLLRDDSTQCGDEYEYVCVAGHRTEFTRREVTGASRHVPTTQGAYVLWRPTARKNGS